MCYPYFINTLTYDNIHKHKKEKRAQERKKMINQNKLDNCIDDNNKEKESCGPP